MRLYFFIKKRFLQIMEFKQIEDSLASINSTLYNKALKMQFPLLDEDLGVILYFSHLYKCTGDRKYKNQALELFNLLIEDFENHNFSKSFIHGFEGVFYVVNYMKKNEVLKSDSVIEDLIPYLLESLEYDLKHSRYIFLHGCLGKSLFFLVSDKFEWQYKEELFNKIIDVLYENRTYKAGSVTWPDYWLKNIVIYPHHIQIFNFLLKLKQSGLKNDKLEIIISQLADAFNEAIDHQHGVEIKGKFQQLDTSIHYIMYSVIYYKIAEVLLYYYQNFEPNNKDVSTIVDRLINIASKSNLKNSGIIDLQKKGLYDIGISQGISSVVYSLYNITKLSDDKTKVSSEYSYWLKKLLEQAKLYTDLDNDEVILMPEYIYQNEAKDYPFDRFSLYDGILGAGFVLSTILYQENEWSEILSYNR